MDVKSEHWNELERTIVACHQCPRLVAWREEVARVRRRAFRDFEYWGKPVPGLGDYQARVLIVGLAPAAHGANRTGRMFTGDSSGSFLFNALHQAGFANQSTAIDRGDGLNLKDIFITAVCRCAPPANRPTRAEMDNCLPYIAREMELLKRLEGIVALGRIAFDNTLRLFRQNGDSIPNLDFSHGAVYELGQGLPWMVVSYHPSRQNTQTGRLTEEMFANIWKKVGDLLDST
jgi:uracil-DNA glycosylase family 4